MSHSQAITENDIAYNLHPYTNLAAHETQGPLVIDHGEGIYVWDDHGKSHPLDFDRMLKIVLDTGFRGYCGIEFGGYEGLNKSRELLEQSRARLTASRSSSS